MGTHNVGFTGRFLISYSDKMLQEISSFISSHHVETAVLLRGEKVDGHIQVDLDIEELEDKSGISF